MNYKSFLGLAAGVLACACQPSVAVENPVVNGDFEKSTDDQAEGWIFGGTGLNIFQLKFPTEPGRGKVLSVTSYNGGLSTYVTREVKVKPNARYRLSGDARLTAGTGLMYVHGTGPRNLEELGRAYLNLTSDHPLAPNFWRKSWVSGNASRPEPWRGTYWNYLAEPGEWVPISLEFNSGTMETIHVSLGVYFQAGTYFFDNIALTELPVQKEGGQ